MRRVSVAATLLCCLAGCSTIIEGRSQQIAVNTIPDGAKCALEREGAKIGSIEQTPGSINIEKTKYKITITCTKDGYKDVQLVDESDSDAATVGNIILGGGIGWAIDSATGSDNKYESPVTITLVKQE